MNLCNMFVEEKREEKKWRTGNERGRLDLYDSLDPITWRNKEGSDRGNMMASKSLTLGRGWRKWTNGDCKSGVSSYMYYEV